MGKTPIHGVTSAELVQRAKKRMRRGYGFARRLVRLGERSFLLAYLKWSESGPTRATTGRPRKWCYASTTGSK
jgi:hypothetical protein